MAASIAATASPSAQRRPARSLGRTCSASAQAGENYFHALLDGIGRLAPIPQPVVDASAGVIAAAAPRGIAALAERFHGGAKRPSVVAHGEHVRVAELTVAFNTSGQTTYHPCLAPLFERLAGPRPAPCGPGGAIYIDRRQSAARCLVNEGELVAALAAEGVAPVRLERLDLDAQITAFRGARLVVAPHGAGLANLLFAVPGARVLELLMDGYCNWSFRHLAALKGLPYDCILGRGRGTWPHQVEAVHGMSWDISVPHVVAAVRALRA